MSTIDQLYFGESILYEFMIHNVFAYEKVQEFRGSYLKGLENNNKKLSQQAIEDFKKNPDWYLQDQWQYVDTKPFTEILEHIEDYYSTIMPDEFHSFRRYQYTTLLFTYVFLALRQDERFKEYYLQYIDQTILTKVGKVDIDKLLTYQFNRLGYRMATGSGKTLLMYAIVYMYCKLFAKKTNTLYILVPSDELRKQHTQFIKLFSEGGLGYVGSGTIVDFDAIPLFGDHQVKGKLTTIAGAKNAKFSNNSVFLVDEAHKGASNKGGAVESLKNEYIMQDDTILFEFSATFQEAFKSEKSINLKENLFDYYHFSSIYKYNLFDFNADGFGKDYIVEAVSKAEDEELVDKRRLICDALINFAKQLKGYKELEKQAQLASKQWVKDKTHMIRRSDGLKIYKPLFLGLSRKLDDNPRNKGFKRSQTTLTAILRNISYIFSHLEDFENQITTTGGTARISLSEFFTLLTGEEYTGNAITFKMWYDKQNDEIKLWLGKHIMIINTGQNAKIAESLKNDPELKTAFAYQDFMQSEKLFDQVDHNENLLFLFGSKKFIEGWDSKRPSNILLFKMGGTSTVIATQILGRGLRLYGVDGDGYRHLNYTMQSLKNKKFEYLEQIALFGYDIQEFEKFIEALAGDEFRVGIIKKREYANSFVSYLEKLNIDESDDKKIENLFEENFPLLQDTIGEAAEQIDEYTEQIEITSNQGTLDFIFNDGENKQNLGRLKGRYEIVTQVTEKKLQGGRSSSQNKLPKDEFRKTYGQIFGEDNILSLVETILENNHSIKLNNSDLKKLSEFVTDIELVTDKIDSSLTLRKRFFELDHQDKVLDFFMTHLELLIDSVSKRLKNYKYKSITTEISSLRINNLIDELRLDFTLHNEKDQELVDLFFGDAPKLSLEKNFEELNDEQKKVIKELFIQRKSDKHIYERLYYLPEKSSIGYLHDIADSDVLVRMPKFSPFDLNINKNEEEKIESILARIANDDLDETYEIFYLRNLVGKKGVYLQYEDVTGELSKFYPDFIFWFINKDDSSDITLVYLEPKGDGIDKNAKQKEKRLHEITSQSIPEELKKLFKKGANIKEGKQHYDSIKVLGVMQFEY